MLTLTPASQSIAAIGSRGVYGSALPALIDSFTGLVGGETPSVFTGALATTAASGSNVGNYAIAS